MEIRISLEKVYVLEIVEFHKKEYIFYRSGKFQSITLIVSDWRRTNFLEDRQNRNLRDRQTDRRTQIAKALNRKKNKSKS